MGNLNSELSLFTYPFPVYQQFGRATDKDLLRTSLILGQGLLLSKYQNSGSKFNSGSFGPSKRSAKGKNDITIKDVESQENILENDGNRDKLHDKGIAMGNIRRTDQVTIDYETASGQDHSQDSW
ncbi:hypothetical protein N7468_007460 [Penicillium chermesinum]|uniref:Uncharacterized protein n=1 Tax=Penicillium chermesinum TaxID=63820 RepID=A0A9W9TM75_9EURO|nr:uncharacterized protein N7468_007460 [Penicillium chermesinum]KAJ5226235.1 hypothetical protein N7468_007460 [Penicillium chermesinum]